MADPAILLVRVVEITYPSVRRSAPCKGSGIAKGSLNYKPVSVYQDENPAPRV